MKSESCKGLLLATVLALGSGAALAQKPEPVVNTGQMPNSREAVRAEAREAARNTSNTLVPAGEASTMTNNQPNMQSLPLVERSRSEVRQSALPMRPRFGQTGERPMVPTNPEGAGTDVTPQ